MHAPWGEPDTSSRLGNGPESNGHTAVVARKALGIGFAWVIVDLAPDGILVSDEDGEIVMANRQVEDMFGYPRQTVVGTHVESLLPIESRPVHRVHRARYRDAPRTRAMGAGLELFGRHADGTEFPVEISLSAVAADHGPVTVAVIRDLRRQRAREQPRLNGSERRRQPHQRRLERSDHPPSVRVRLEHRGRPERPRPRRQGQRTATRRPQRTRCRGERHPHHDLPTPGPNTRHATRRLTTCPEADFLTRKAEDVDDR